ncbi:hypothetical protein N431DRAFT_429653, partial [Stipitochalara longipes BDJ]
MPPRSLLLLTTLAVPAASALLLQAYLYNSPLPAKKTSTIRTFHTLSPTCSTSPSLKIVNPRSLPNNSAPDSRYITLSRSETRNLTDEEILSRFLRGFYNGWIFLPEKGIISLFRTAGRKMVAVGFTGVSMDGLEISSPAEISRERLPEKGTILMSGNFMVLDKYVRKEEKEGEGEKEGGPSFIEIGYGDNRKGFAGFHRFEVERRPEMMEKEEREEGGVRLWYSSISCHPRENKLPLPGWLFHFHDIYAQSLFRDGIREVL